MAEIKKIYDDAARTTQVYPQTHERAVVDNNGTTAETKFQMVTELVQQAQMEVGAVPSDLTPTAGSTNWVMSGGLYDSLNVSEVKTIDDVVKLASNIIISDTTYAKGTGFGVSVLDVSKYKGLRIMVTSNTLFSILAFMQSYNFPSVGTSLGTFATGYSARIVQEASTTVVYDIPEDCNYILINYKTASDDVFPTYLSIETAVRDKVSELDSEVKAIDNEVYVGGEVPSSFTNSGNAIVGTYDNGVLTIVQNSASTGFVQTNINTNLKSFKIRFKARLSTYAAPQTVYVGFASSTLSASTASITIDGTTWQQFALELSGTDVASTAYNIAFTITSSLVNTGNVIEISNIIITFDGERESILVRLDELESKGSSERLGYTFNTEAFLQGCDRHSKYLVKIACAGDSLTANAIGGNIPSQIDEGNNNCRPMRLLTNSVPRRLYDYISWNKPIWRRLDHSDWTKSGWTAFSSSQMDTICQGTNPGLWGASSQGSYAEITIPQGYEHFAIIVRLKSGNGTLDVTLNGGDVGTYTNPYYTSKVATNTVVDASVVPQYIARGLSAINTNSGTTATGNIYHIVEYNNLPSGQANTLRFTTASATEVDIWGGFYWSGNTCVVMNIAQGGHTTSDLLNDHLPDELFAEDYDAVLFEVTEMNNLRLSLSQTKTDLQTIVSTLKTMDVEHCFTSCNPLGLSITYDTNFYTNYTNPTQLQINDAVGELLKANGEAFIDLFQYFRWHIERRGGTLTGGQGGLWYTHDGQHGNEAGVKLWFDALRKVICDKAIMID